jgi:hypothetical protein
MAISKMISQTMTSLTSFPEVQATQDLEPKSLPTKT